MLRRLKYAKHVCPYGAARRCSRIETSVRLLSETSAKRHSFGSGRSGEASENLSASLNVSRAVANI
jgi:hypothetical protein